MKNKEIRGIGQRLKSLMEEKNITVAELSKEMKSSQRQIRLWLSDKVCIQLSNAIKISLYFECSFQYLMGLTDLKTVKK